MKKLFAISAILLLAMSAKAGYLKWQVGEGIGDDMSAVDSYAETAKIENWDRAHFYEVDANGVAKFKQGMSGVWQEAGPRVVEISIDSTSTAEQIAAYSYYIELANSKGEVVGHADGSYASLAGFVVDTMPEPSIVPSLQTWHAGTYTAAPEPTSAMLMLLGVAGLALRRKQRKA